MGKVEGTPTGGQIFFAARRADNIRVYVVRPRRGPFVTPFILFCAFVKLMFPMPNKHGGHFGFLVAAAGLKRGRGCKVPNMG